MYLKIRTYASRRQALIVAFFIASFVSAFFLTQHVFAINPLSSSISGFAVKIEGGGAEGGIITPSCSTNSFCLGYNYAYCTADDLRGMDPCGLETESLCPSGKCCCRDQPYTPYYPTFCATGSHCESIPGSEAACVDSRGPEAESCILDSEGLAEDCWDGTMQCCCLTTSSTTSTTTTSLPCVLTHAQIDTALCGDDCEPGEEVTITGAVTESGIGCPATAWLQIDAKDFPDSICFIQGGPPDGTIDIDGVNGEVTFNGVDTFTGTWLVPDSIPFDCQGVTVGGYGAALYGSGGVGLMSGPSPAGGSITFDVECLIHQDCIDKGLGTHCDSSTKTCYEYPSG
ncbi:MAG: hypothetical protein ABH950_00770, partial [Candidatus Altiarchaeota archaeon]